MRLDPDGKSLLKEGPAAAWAYVSISADPLGEGAWVVERSHPQVVPSIDRLLFVTADGKVTRRIHRPGWQPFGVACDRGGMWSGWPGWETTDPDLARGRLVREFPILSVAVAVGWPAAISG